MRDNRSKLIAVWVPGNHGAGGSTIANGIGISLQHFTGKRTLIINLGSPKSYMERYLENDVEIRFSMDYLKSFDEKLTAEHVRTYAAQINENLFILPNCRIGQEVSGVGPGFYQRLLDEAMKVFDFVIVDIETGIHEEKSQFLDRADLILAVITRNEIMLDDLYRDIGNTTLRAYLDDVRSLTIVNGIYPELNIAKELKAINSKYNISSSYGVKYDIAAYQAGCIQRKFYSFLKNQLSSKSYTTHFPEQMEELCGLITQRLYTSIEEAPEKRSLLNMFFHKVKQWGDVNA